jgi:flavin reductase (DIM6/NTAB) family NADH-FMN oxidoreductase RutF
MEFNLANFSERETYALLTQTIIPRPIAWVLSENILITETQEQSFNLAPFSFFNGIAAKPALIMLSIGAWDDDGKTKDTLVNIRKLNSFTIGIPSYSQDEAVQMSAVGLPYGVSELELNNIPTSKWEWPTPLIAECPINFACTYKMEVNPEGSTQTVVFAEISKINISDAVIGHDEKGRISVNPVLVDPLLRLGNGVYGKLGSTKKATKGYGVNL